MVTQHTARAKGFPPPNAGAYSREISFNNRKSRVSRSGRTNRGVKAGRLAPSSPPLLAPGSQTSSIFQQYKTVHLYSMILFHVYPFDDHIRIEIQTLRSYHKPPIRLEDEHFLKTWHKFFNDDQIIRENGCITRYVQVYKERRSSANDTTGFDQLSLCDTRSRNCLPRRETHPDIKDSSTLSRRMTRL